MKPGIPIKKGNPIFPRIEEKKEEEPLNKNVAEKPTEKFAEQISIEDFARIDLRVAKVLTAEKVEASDKLLKLKIKVAGEERQIVAGIAQHYQPDQLIGSEIIVVANLKPAKLRGLLSEGMLLAASNQDGKLAFLRPEMEIGEGSKVK